MEYIGILAPPLRVIPFLRKVAMEDRGIKAELRHGLDKLKIQMLGMMHEDLQTDEQELQELAYDIEDFIHNLAPAAYSIICTALGTNPGSAHVERINYFIHWIQDLQERRKNRSGVSGGVTPEPPSAGSPCYTEEKDLVGIAKPKEELLELLSPSKGPLRVISVVGCSGLGKTALAWAVYGAVVVGDHGANAFDCKAWVVASEHSSTDDILKEILRQLDPQAASDTTSHATQPSVRLHRFLENKRYMVIIDGMEQAGLWKGIKHALPEDDTSGSRIIVTTSIQSLATTWSPGSYRYTMRGLNSDDSQDLLWREIYGNQPREAAMVTASSSILSKCDGSPRALIGVANHLAQYPKDQDRCRDVGKALGTYIASTENGFGELQRALDQCYDSLPDYYARRCLLSVSMFPQGHGINRKSLIRGWIAEGLVVGEVQRESVDVAFKHFDEFVDRSIIEPVLIGNSSNVKRCQVQGTMLEFIVHRSISTNFVHLIHNDKHLPVTRGDYPVRRLSVQDGTKPIGSFADGTVLSCIRWLRIWCRSVLFDLSKCRLPRVLDQDGTKPIGSFADGIVLSSIRWLRIWCRSVLFDLSKCRLLRVLDLEGCEGVDKRVLAKIYDLSFLKYLSLRRSDVKKITKKITKLENLETLDIRETAVKVLPMEVILMPMLAHLFGQFRILPHGSERILRTYSEKNNLQTLGGVVIDEDYLSVKQIMLHARKLKKVKLWYEHTAFRGTQSTPSDVLFPVKKFTGDEVLKSLSIDSSYLSSYFLSDEFLGSLKCYCAIESIKLRGALTNLPDTVNMKLDRLQELQLSLTGLSSEVLSTFLQSLSCLVYLKLKEDRHGFGDGSFVVKDDGFGSLQRLCFEAPKHPLLQIQNGAMRYLTSLQLLCPESPLQAGATAGIDEPLGVEGISHLKILNEVILHHSATQEKVDAWKRAAKMHINRPHVKKQP